MRKERNLNDRIRGALIGGAVGDALGYPVEFMTYDSMVQAYGKNGITRFELTRGIAEFSDDTQMTLFTANGLLNGIIRNRRFHKDTPLADYVSSAYADWYGTQLLQGRMIPENERDCWLASVPQLYSLRAPGNTCLSAIEQRRCGMEVCNHSKGCGGIMRVAPVAFAFGGAGQSDAREKFVRQAGIIRLACEVARLTHLHPLGFLPAGVMAHLLHRIVHAFERITTDWVKRTVFEGLWFLDHLTDPATGTSYNVLYPEALDEMNTMILKTFRLASATTDDVESVRQLGQGWTGDEALYIALYCATRHLDHPGDALVASVNHDGDSDSTGSVTGNIMGAIHGYEAMKEQNLFCPEGKNLEETLELTNVILAIADDLAYVASGNETEGRAVLYERYCETRPADIDLR